MDCTMVSGLKEICGLEGKASGKIASSKISVGFETLDRELFKPERCYDALGASGAKHARCQTGWSRCEKTEGVFDFKWLDEVVDELLKRGVQPWFNVGFGNKLYMPDVPHESAVGCVPLYYPQRTQEAWKRYVRELTRHFQGRVSHYEIWNECNIDSFWRPGASNPEEYTRFVGITAKEIRGVDKTAKTGACIAGGYGDFALATLRAGIGEFIDFYSIHPYGNIPERYYEEGVSAFKTQLAKLAPHVKLWQGECGCPSATKEHNDEWLGLFNMDETKQAKWMLRRLLTDLHVGMELASYFHIADLMEKEYRQANGQVRKPVMMGLLNGKTYTPKFAWKPFCGLCALFDDETAPAPLYMHADWNNKGRCESHLADFSIRKLRFVRKGYPLYCVYSPEDVQLETPVRNHLNFAVMDDAERKIEEPVLLDLLQMKAFDIKANARSWGFEGMPMADYPLIVTDRALLQDLRG